MHAGQVLYATGDSSYDLFLIESVAVDVVGETSITFREHVVYTRTAGDFMGELSILTGQTVYVTARVRKPGLVVQIGAQAFRTALAEQVDIADVLIEAFRLRRRIMLDSAGSALEIVGQPDTASNRALRTYAARLQLPHSPFDADSVAGRSLMAAYGLVDEDLPAAVLFDRVLVRATPQDVARPSASPSSRRTATSTSSWSARGRLGSPRPCTARRRVWSPCCWMPRVPVVRLRPRRASRTTWGSPAGSAVTT